MYFVRGKDSRLKYNISILQHDDLAEFRSMLRMNPATYYELLALVGPELQRQNTVMRQAVTPDQRLTVTLHYLAHGKLNHRHPPQCYQTWLEALLTGQFLHKSGLAEKRNNKYFGLRLG